MNRPAKAMVETRINNELARRPEGKSLAVGCALDLEQKKRPYRRREAFF